MYIDIYIYKHLNRYSLRGQQQILSNVSYFWLSVVLDGVSIVLFRNDSSLKIYPFFD